LFIIGIYFYKEEQIDDLLYLLINFTKKLYPNGVSIIGSICSSLFVSFAMNNIDINKWIDKIINLLKSKKFKKIYLDNTDNQNKYNTDLELYLHKLNKYNSIKDIDIVKYNPGARIQYYFNHFTENKDIFYPGNSGDDCIIIIYDIIYSNYKIKKNYSNYEKLYIDLGLNSGNNNNLFTIGSCLFGLLNDYEYINSLIINNEKIAKKIKFLYEKLKI
jgi:hypothetical protein